VRRMLCGPGLGVRQHARGDREVRRPADERHEDQSRFLQLVVGLAVDQALQDDRAAITPVSHRSARRA